MEPVARWNAIILFTVDGVGALSAGRFQRGDVLDPALKTCTAGIDSQSQLFNELSWCPAGSLIVAHTLWVAAHLVRYLG